MNKYVFTGLAIIAAALIFGVYTVSKLPKTNSQAFATDNADQASQQFKELAKGKVTAVLSKDENHNPYLPQITESLQVTLLSGSEKGKQVTVNYQDVLTNAKLQEIKTGDLIVVGTIQTPDETSYVLADRYRLPYLGYVALLFLALALIFGRIRGFTAIIGLLISIAILIWFIAPNILAGKDPVLVTAIGAGIIAIVSMFFAHGFKRRTALAVISTLITLSIAEVLAQIFVGGARLLGNGSEAAFYIQTGYFGAINLQGLLLGGIMIGTLGVLNDITTAQAATVEEIHTANPGLSLKELYNKASSVGREHIASLINTLVLIYVGASLPLFLLFTVNSKQLWTVLNSGSIAEEIIRTLVGSIALILAVPLTTFLASLQYRMPKQTQHEHN